MPAPEDVKNPLPYSVERVARALCETRCRLVQCRLNPVFCPYWEPRVDLARAALDVVGIIAVDLPEARHDGTRS